MSIAASYSNYLSTYYQQAYGQSFLVYTETQATPGPMPTLQQAQLPGQGNNWQQTMPERGRIAAAEEQRIRFMEQMLELQRGQVRQVFTQWGPLFEVKSEKELMEKYPENTEY